MRSVKHVLLLTPRVLTQKPRGQDPKNPYIERARTRKDFSLEESIEKMFDFHDWDAQRVNSGSRENQEKVQEDAQSINVEIIKLKTMISPLEGILNPINEGFVLYINSVPALLFISPTLPC